MGTATALGTASRNRGPMLDCMGTFILWVAEGGPHNDAQAWRGESVRHGKLKDSSFLVPLAWCVSLCIFSGEVKIYRGRMGLHLRAAQLKTKSEFAFRGRLNGKENLFAQTPFPY
jgi:hypothetical protein